MRRTLEGSTPRNWLRFTRDRVFFNSASVVCRQIEGKKLDGDPNFHIVFLWLIYFLLSLSRTIRDHRNRFTDAQKQIYARGIRSIDNCARNVVLCQDRSSIVSQLPPSSYVRSSDFRVIFYEEFFKKRTVKDFLDLEPKRTKDPLNLKTSTPIKDQIHVGRLVSQRELAREGYFFARATSCSFTR